VDVGIGTGLRVEDYERLLEQLPAMVWRANERAECSFCSRSWNRFTGVSRLGIGWLEPIHPEDRHKYMSTYRTAVGHRAAFEVQYRLRTADGTYRWVVDRAAPTEDLSGRFDGFVGICVDVTEQVVEAEAEQTRLRGLLPICAHCKSIRDDRGYWHSVEAYMSEHTDAELSHGICPDCMKKLYPELQDAQDALRSTRASKPTPGAAQSVAGAAAAKLVAAFDSVAGACDRVECAACAHGAAAG
jgi:PAS domain S-box-containing protein